MEWDWGKRLKSKSGIRFHSHSQNELTTPKTNQTLLSELKLSLLASSSKLLPSPKEPFASSKKLLAQPTGLLPLSSKLFAYSNNLFASLNKLLPSSIKPLASNKKRSLLQNSTYF
jgi:hypothetical protein